MKKSAAKKQINKRLARQFKLERTSRGLQAKWVANKMGISRSYLCDLELARRRWTDKLIKAFEDVLDN